MIITYYVGVDLLGQPVYVDHWLAEIRVKAYK